MGRQGNTGFGWCRWDPQALVVERGTEQGGPLLEEGQRGRGRTGRVGVREVEGNSEQGKGLDVRKSVAFGWGGRS